ncbi:DUF3750 domain-containing protein [Candidatus Gracilibacteria bacterium]|nr:DUF3750 domain-containing protein [Candidatus Gracilibacteria bacterium]
MINENGVFSRYEILFQKNRNEDKGHLHIDSKNVFAGLGIIPLLKKPIWKGKILYSISGPIAQKIIQEVKKSEAEYPHIRSYQLTGPNSNTYTQWILNKFPEWKAQLPWNAFGK